MDYSYSETRKYLPGKLLAINSCNLLNIYSLFVLIRLLS